MKPALRIGLLFLVLLLAACNQGAGTATPGPVARLEDSEPPIETTETTGSATSASEEPVS